MSPQAVPKGFPSPAEDYKEKLLDLNTLLVKNPPATFFVRCKSNSMYKAGIFPNDILVVDRSVTAYDGSIVLAFLDGDFFVRRFSLKKGRTLLSAEHDRYVSEEISGDLQDFSVWGVVTYVIHKPNNNND